MCERVNRVILRLKPLYLYLSFLAHLPFCSDCSRSPSPLPLSSSSSIPLSLPQALFSTQDVLSTSGSEQNNGKRKEPWLEDPLDLDHWHRCHSGDERGSHQTTGHGNDDEAGTTIKSESEPK